MKEEKAALEKAANAARKKAQVERNKAKTRMKGKNKASKQFRKNQTNIIEDRKVMGERQSEAAFRLFVKHP